jgi:hypothetical protein
LAGHATMPVQISLCWRGDASLITVILIAGATIPYTLWVGLQTSRFTQFDHLPEGTFANMIKPKACTAAVSVVVWRASTRPTGSGRGCVALWRGEKVPRCPDGGRAIDCSGFCFGSHELSGAGSVLGGDAARAVEIRHGDSGYCGTRDGVAERRYVPVVGEHQW